MTTYRSQAKSTSNPSIIAAIRTARSHVTILSEAVGERKWQTINHKNLAVKVKLAFLMDPFSSMNKSAPSPSINKCWAIHLLVVSQRWLTQELSIFNNLPPVVELGGERGPGGINILVIQILAHGWQGDVDLYVAYSNVLKWACLAGAFCLSICDRRVST